MQDYALKDNAAYLFNLGKSRNMHNIGCQNIKNGSKVNKLIMLGFDTFKESIDTHGKNFYLNFFNNDIPPIKNLYNQYIVDNGMKLFVPINITNPQHVLYYINRFGPENAGYAIFNDCIVPSFLTYEDKFMLSQLPP